LWRRVSARDLGAVVGGTPTLRPRDTPPHDAAAVAEKLVSAGRMRYTIACFLLVGPHPTREVKHMDPRIERLAGTLVRYSIGLKKGQLLKIQGEAVSIPLITAVFKEALKVGAHPYAHVSIPDNEEAMLKHGTDAQLKYISPVTRFESKKIDALVAIWGSENTKYLSGIDPRRQALSRRSRGPLLRTMFKRIADQSLSWVGTQFPTLADAQEAGMSLSEYEDFVYRAGHVDKGDPVKHWKRVAREQARLVRILDRVDRLHIQAGGTDLKMRVKGRKWINCAGTENFPDGEIFSSPLEDTVEGRIHFSFPAIYMGREVEDVRLEFKKGRVVKESAGKEEGFLKAMLATDKGARSVGEIAIGTNYDIKRFSKNILFDEKIGGTCHMALGASILEAGGKNKSAIHWDMICDLKKQAEITADGKVIYRNGKFLI
jgi:aminopeptidase